MNREKLFSKENIKWYRRITAFQLSLGVLAAVFLFWTHQQEKGSYDIIQSMPYQPSSFYSAHPAVASKDLNAAGLIYDDDRHVFYGTEGGSTIQVFDPQDLSLQDQFTVRTPQGQEIEDIHLLAYANQGLYGRLAGTSHLIYIETGRFNRGRLTNDWELDDWAQTISQDYPDFQDFNQLAPISEEDFYISADQLPLQYEIELH